MTQLQFMQADLGASSGAFGLTTTRPGGVSEGVYAQLNLATHVHDKPAHVAENRQRLFSSVGAGVEPLWLDQRHGSDVFVVDTDAAVPEPPPADAAVCSVPGRILAVLTADCLPVLLASSDQQVIGIAHAGWRGLAAGVLENTLQAMDARVAGVHAWLGPAIGPQHFEVGADVFESFVSVDAGAEACFSARGDNKWLADLAGLATRRLRGAGVTNISQADCCTFSDASRFFSYRRDGECGRMASLIWLEAN